MTLQVLVSTMHQTDHALLDEMNIQTDAVVINQCDRDLIESFEYKGKNILWLNLSERGVGRSRNTAILRSKADILLFADDDVRYFDGYGEAVLRFFEEHPKVDLAVFNFQSQNPNRPEAIVEKDYRLHWYNCLKFGAFRIAVRREALERSNVFFSFLFGGGAKYQSGEDNVFVVQSLRSGMKGMASALHLGTVKQEESTWFKGCDERYFHDKGVLMRTMFGFSAYLLIIALIVRHPDHYAKVGLGRALRSAYKGCGSVRRLR